MKRFKILKKRWKSSNHLGPSPNNNFLTMRISRALMFSLMKTMRESFKTKILTVYNSRTRIHALTVRAMFKPVLVVTWTNKQLHCSSMIEETKVIWITILTYKEPPHQQIDKHYQTHFYQEEHLGPQTCSSHADNPQLMSKIKNINSLIHKSSRTRSALAESKRDKVWLIKWPFQLRLVSLWMQTIRDSIRVLRVLSETTNYKARTRKANCRVWCTSEGLTS